MQLTLSSKAPGFINPCAYEVKTWFLNLLFQIPTCTATLWWMAVGAAAAGLCLSVVAVPAVGLDTTCQHVIIVRQTWFNLMIPSMVRVANLTPGSDKPKHGSIDDTVKKVTSITDYNSRISPNRHTVPGAFWVVITRHTHFITDTQYGPCNKQSDTRE
jgi:hypothetical protein